jgi:hypothetical protein
MKFLGLSEEGISLYIKDLYENKSKQSAVKEIYKIRSDKKAEIISLKFFDQDSNETSFIESGQEINIALDCILREELNNPIFGVNFYGDVGFMYCANSYYEDVRFEEYPLGKIRVKINIPHLHLPTHSYLCSVIIAEESITNLIDWHDMAYRLAVGRAKNARGSIKLLTKWEIEKYG